MFDRPYMFVPDRITLPDLFPIGLLPTRPYTVLPGELPYPISS
jgi:hypothetical protein